MMKPTLLIAAMSTAMLVTAAEARGPSGPFGAGGFGAEAPEFGQLDTDGDGLLTQEELQSSMQAMAAERFAEADADSDGALSVDEIIAMEQRMRAEAMIARLDTDGDGLLSQEEMTARMQQQAEANADRRARMFDRFDADDDGAVSEQEYQTALSFLQQMGEGRGERGMYQRHGEGGMYQRHGGDMEHPHGPYGGQRPSR